MRNTRFASLFLLVLTFFGHWPTRANAQTGIEILERFVAAAGKIQTLSYTQIKTERIAGKNVSEKMFVNMQRAPFRLYQKFEYPRNGLQVLYITGANNGKALVRPNGFPYTSLSLDPMGGMMRENQHHTIFQVGYDHLVEILSHLKTRYGTNASKYIKYDGLFVWNNIKCWKVTLGNPAFAWSNYTVQAGENLLTIAKKFRLSEDMIKEKNKLRGYESVRAGQVIQIPSDYSKTGTFYIDINTSLPILFEVSDELGVYEHYEFYNVKVNPALPANTFDPKNPSYNF
jgi:outer membrane lipoprotein-sorting protein